MSFDAGSVIASMRLDLTRLDRDISDAERKLDRLDRGHEIKIAAVLDDATTNKARRLFAQLDNQLSRDAMQRLRGSPQGSVLGALNALFSPHQVAGGPTAQQAGSQGLLGKMVGGTGSGGAVGTSPGHSNSTVTTADVIKTMVTGQQPGNVTTTDTIKRQVVGAQPGNIETTDTIKEKLDPASAEQVRKDSATAGDRSGASFADSFRKHLSSLFSGGGSGGAGGKSGGGGAGSGNFFGNLLGGIGPGILGVSTKAAAGVGIGGSLLGSLPALIGGLAPLLPGLAGIAGLGVLAKSATGQVSPLLQQQSQAQQALATATTPQAAQAAQAQLQGVNQAVKQLPPALQSIFKSINQIQNAWQGLTGTFAPLIAQALSQVAKLLQALSPELKQFFAASGTLIQPLLGGLTDIAKSVLPLLSQAIKIAAPELKPLLDGLGNLISGLLPGLIVLLKAAMPAVQALAQIFGMLGKDLGSMLTAFAPVVKSSVVILKALFDVLGSLFPIIGKLAAIFASALAPVFLQFAGVIKSLLPFITLVGNVLAQLASAVLGDLMSAFSALAQLLQAIAPGLNTFAKAFSQIFSVLENTGVFAILGNALEGLVKPLAGLINALLNGLSPVLPPIINFISQLVTMLASGLAQAIATLIPPITKLVTSGLQVLADVLPVVLPLLLKLAGIFTGAIVGAVAALATALAAVINALPPSVLGGIVVAVVAIVGAIKLWTIAQGLLDIALSANPIGVFVLALAGLVIGITELVTHWTTVWDTIKKVFDAIWPYILGDLTLGISALVMHWTSSWNNIKKVAEDAWNFIFNGVGKYLLPLLGPAGVIALAAIELYQHWGMIWGGIKQVALDFYNWIWSDFGAKISNFLTHTMPGWFSDASTAIGHAWNAVKAVVTAPIRFIIDDVIDGLISAFDWISDKVGGPHINPVHPFGLKAGGKITAGTTPTADDVLIRVSKDETVLSAKDSEFLAPLLAMLGVPGYARGGRPTTGPSGTVLPPVVTGTPVGSVSSSGGGGGGILGSIASFFGNALDFGKILAALATGNTTALINAISGLLPGSAGHAVGDMAGLITAIPKTLIKAAVSSLINAFTSSTAGSTGLGPGQAGPGGGAPAANAALARKLYPPWASGAQWSAWNAVAMRESGWNQFARNPSSGAYGIPQALPGSKMGPAANPPQSNPAAQINWMVGYIKAVYGDPAAAWGHEMSNGWYDNGGWLPPGLLNGTGRVEAVLNPSESQAFQQMAGFAASGDMNTRLDRIAGLLSTLIGTAAAIPAATGRHVGGAIGGATSDAVFRARYPR